jgi:hypothetical protein
MAMLNRLRKKIPNLLCPSGNQITRLCTNHICKTAIRCGSINCDSCGKNVHVGCGSIQLEEMTELINDRAEGCREFVYKIFQMEQQFITNIRKAQLEFIDHYGVGIIEGKHKKLINAIYEVDGDSKSVSGKEAY